MANKEVFLVDFSELEQGPEGLAEADVQGLIDHHRIGTLITRGPLDAWIRAVGCSATVLLELMGYDTLSRAQARLLLGPSSAIPSASPRPPPRLAIALPSMPCCRWPIWRWNPLPRPCWNVAPSSVTPP